MPQTIPRNCTQTSGLWGCHKFQTHVWDIHPERRMNQLGFKGLSVSHFSGRFCDTAWTIWVLILYYLSFKAVEDRKQPDFNQRPTVYPYIQELEQYIQFRKLLGKERSRQDHGIVYEKIATWLESPITKESATGRQSVTWRDSMRKAFLSSMTQLHWLRLFVIALPGYLTMNVSRLVFLVSFIHSTLPISGSEFKWYIPQCQPRTAHRLWCTKNYW